MGGVLSAISEHIVTVQKDVNAMAQASREQSLSLQEVNGSIGEMDKVTQQNAAMVEESAAGSIELLQKASVLLQLIERFELGRALAAVEEDERFLAVA